MKPTKEQIASQFDRMSHAYAESPGHARGDDLGIVVRLLAPSPHMRVLDIATGAGHTAAAVAVYVNEVVAIDIAPAMLRRTQELAASRGIANLHTELMDVESLRFPDACFDAATCRIAPHHFVDIDAALGEIARVLRPGGVFVVEDSVVPADPLLDRFLNHVERVRDATHVRSLTEQEWSTKLRAAGLVVVASEMHRKTHDVPQWIARAGLDDRGARRVHETLLTASDAAIAQFEIQFAADRAVRFVDEKIIIRADKAVGPENPGGA